MYFVENRLNNLNRLFFQKFSASLWTQRPTTVLAARSLLKTPVKNGGITRLLPSSAAVGLSRLRSLGLAGSERASDTFPSYGRLSAIRTIPDYMQLALARITNTTHHQQEGRNRPPFIIPAVTFITQPIFIMVHANTRLKQGRKWQIKTT